MFLPSVGPPSNNRSVERDTAESKSDTSSEPAPSLRGGSSLKAPDPHYFNRSFYLPSVPPEMPPIILAQERQSPTSCENVCAFPAIAEAFCMKNSRPPAPCSPIFAPTGPPNSDPIASPNPVTRVPTQELSSARSR